VVYRFSESHILGFNQKIQYAVTAHAFAVPVPRKPVALYGKAVVLFTTVRAAPMGECEAPALFQK
jgi:hypothetical protein